MPRSLAVERPSIVDLAEACQSLSLPFAVEPDKAYPRDFTTRGRVRVMLQDEYQRMSQSFFLEFLGSSWHGDDARFIFWMGQNWLLLTLGGVAAAAALALMLWWLYQRVLALVQSRDWAKRGWRAVLGRVGRREYELVDRRVD